MNVCENILINKHYCQNLVFIAGCHKCYSASRYGLLRFTTHLKLPVLENSKRSVITGCTNYGVPLPARQLRGLLLQVIAWCQLQFWSEINKSCHWQVCSLQRQVAFLIWVVYLKSRILHAAFRCIALKFDLWAIVWPYNIHVFSIFNLLFLPFHDMWKYLCQSPVTNTFRNQTFLLLLLHSIKLYSRLYLVFIECEINYELFMLLLMIIIRILSFRVCFR